MLYEHRAITLATCEQAKSDKLLGTLIRLDNDRYYYKIFIAENNRIPDIRLSADNINTLADKLKTIAIEMKKLELQKLITKE